MICKSEKLSKLDDDLAAVFKSAAKASREATAIYLDQAAWLKKSRAACKNTYCLQVEYEKRITVLMSWNSQVEPNDSIYGSYIYPHEVGVYNQNNPDGPDYVEVVDCLEIKKISPNKANITVAITQTNGHTCSIDGNFTLSNGVFTYDSPLEDMKCKLSINIKSHSIAVWDPDMGCSTPTNCGARADLSGMEFLRSKKSNSVCSVD